MKPLRGTRVWSGATPGVVDLASQHYGWCPRCEALAVRAIRGRGVPLYQCGRCYETTARTPRAWVVDERGELTLRVIHGVDNVHGWAALGGRTVKLERRSDGVWHVLGAS